MIEQLDRRDMLAVDGWNNVLQPLSVLADPNQDVSPLDVLAVINEINGRRYSDALGRLPDQPPSGERPPYFDVNCNGSVEPLDALMVINHLNGGPKPTSWNHTTANGSSGSGFVSAASCSPQLNEGTSLRTELVTQLVIPSADSAVRVSFSRPTFDTASTGTMRDAFEIAVRDTSGNLLVLPYHPRLEAVVNWTEDSATVNGPAVQMQSTSNDWTSTINLVGIAAGTRVQVSVRLLNNDSDTDSHVVVRGIEVIPATGPNPVGSPWADESTAINETLRWPMMQEVTGSVTPAYSRTTYTNDRSTLISEVAFENRSSLPIRSAIAVLDNLSDLSIQPIQPDGYTDDGRPYWRIGATASDGVLASNATSPTRSIRFSSTAQERFTFTWRIYGELLQGNVAFQSRPDDVIERGNTYRYQATATSSLGRPIRYRLVTGPGAATLSETTGVLSWITTNQDVGRHQFVVRAVDDYGNEALQSFSVDVRNQLVNRPPIITSEPETDTEIASPYEVHTYATGKGPAAATLLPTRSGLMHVVTANSLDNQLGRLSSGPFVLGSSQPIDIGELPASALLGAFDGPMAIELGIVPNTEGRFERNVQQVLAEDVNGDGSPDAVALVNLEASGNWSDSNDRGFLVVRYGNGDGSFREGWQVQLPTVTGRIGRAATVHFADVTSDGLKDLVVTTIATNRILVYANEGTGTFEPNPITSAVTGNYVSNTQIADLDRDGNLDLVLFENVQVQIGGRQAISVYRGDGTGRFAESQVITADTNNGGNGYLADVDGLNGPDIVRLNYTNVRLETYLNDGTGSFGNRIDSETKLFYQPNSGNLFHPVSGYFEDFDSDGKIDAVIFGGNGANFIRGQGNGRFGDGTANGSKPLIPQQGLIFGIGNMSGRGLDLNGDEHLDILVGNPQSYSNLIAGLGRGDGTFDLSMYGTDFESDVGTGITRDSQSMVYASAADFNRDGVVDVLLGNTQRGQQAGNVGLLLGDRPGTFRAPQSLRNFDFSGGGSPSTFGMRESVTGDFNNDGILDIVTGGSIGFGYGFYFAPGRGDGTFGKYEVVFGGVGGSNSLTVLDIDRDGNLDLAWIDGSQFRQAFGLGNGAFQALPSVPAPGGAGSFQNALQVDDFNGDGYPDLVHRLQTGNIDTNFITRLVVLLFDPVNRRYNTLPDVNDTMTNWPRAGGYYWDESIGMGDLNGDGKKEFFAYSRSIPNSNTPARWIVFEQAGGSATDASTLFRKTVIENPGFLPPDRSIYSYVIDDFDGDGINDIAYSSNSLHTTVMFGNGDFTFRDSTQYYTHTFQLDSGDFNGDGVTDLVAMWGWGFLSYSSRPYQSILYGRGDGTFSEMHGFTAVANILMSAIGDFNGDGRDDIAGTPDQTQGVAFTSRPKGVSDVASGDLNGDGTADLVSIISGLDRVKVNHQKWDASFERVDDLFTDLFPVAVDLLDIDRNGMLDVVTANQQGKSLSILRQVTRGQFERNEIELPHRPSDLLLSDLNRDGTEDVLVLSQKDRSLMTLLGSNGNLSLSLVLPLGFTPGDFTVGDLTGDGIPDVGASDPDGDRLLIFPGVGDGTFGSPITVLGVANPGSLAIAEMNRDGRQDLVVAQPNNERVGVLYQRSPGKFTTPQWIGVGKTPGGIVVEDANGDGATDILVVNQGDDTISLILNRFDPNRLWKYQPTAVDPDGDPVSFELIDAPGGMLLDPSTNTIYWAPMPEQLGVNQVVIEASDGRGGATQQGFLVTVTAPVAQIAPQFTSTPVTQVASDSVYRYQPNVVHQERAAVRYSLVQAPEGMTIDPTTGEVHWDARTSSMKLYTGARNYGLIEASDSPSLRPASVTVEGWYYFEDPKGAVYENLLAKRSSASNPNLVSFGLEYYYGTLRAKVGTPANNNSLAVVTAPAPVEFQKWTHVAMTFDDASRTLTLFINGENVGTVQSPEAIGYNDSPLQAGRNITILARQRVWNRALTPAEITSGMLADVPRDAAGLVLQWEFNESRDASTVFDTSLSRNHGNLVQTPDWLYFPTRQRGLASQASHDVILRVEDGRGGVAEQVFRVDVVSPFENHVSGIVFSDANGDGSFDGPQDVNRIANGDFSSGIAGWESDFFERVNQPTTGWLGNSQVTIGPSAAAIPLTSGYGGHTNGSSQDLMLVVNGDNRDRVAWRQMVTLNDGQSYDFSFWAIRPNIYEAARLMVRWNGQPMGSIFTLDDVSAGTWKQFRHSFTPTSESGVLEIVSLGSALTPNPGLSGTENSFAIDDLMLTPSEAQRVLVPGTANPYLAGMPNGSTAYGSTAPQGSPPSIDVQPGQVLRIRATGHTRSDGFIATRSPDGIVHNATGTVSNAINGISQYAGPNHGSLLGVFLDAQAPLGQAAPTGLDFRANGNVSDGINYLSISPQLRQLFFVGDGFTNDGNEQTIVVPQGATRLFFANSSSNSWINNTGSFEVQVFRSSSESVQAGRTVYLDSNRNHAYDPGEPTATTDANGRYMLAAPGPTALVGLVGIAGQLQSTPRNAVTPVDLNSVTPMSHFGSRTISSNQTPIFVTEPITTAVAPGNYQYQLFAQSPKGQRVQYELASGPQGMTLDSVSGLLQWNPLASQAGTHEVLIQAFDVDRQFTIQRYTINVLINTEPIITSSAPVSSHPGVSWEYRVRAQDAETFHLTYRLISGPAGMTISSDKGIIDYVPSGLGAFHFEVEVSDGQGGTTRQSSSVTVVPSGVNEPPRDLRGASGAAIIDRVFASQLSAMDDDYEPVTYSLVQGPAGMTVSTDGQLLWKPSDPGSFNVKIAATDPRGGRTETVGVVHVVSRAPRPTLIVNSLPETAARVGKLYSYDVVAPGSVLFELVDAPVGMSIDPQFGTIRWIPTRDSLGVNEVQLRCTDLFGNAVTQEFTIAVRSSSLVPTISSAPTTEAAVGRTYLYSLRTDNPSSSPLLYELVIAPQGMQIDYASGEIQWTPTEQQVGPTTVSIRVSDGLGNFSTQSYAIFVAAGMSNLAPVITSSADFDAIVGQPYQYILQANDPENAAVTFGVRSAPNGFSIHPSTGVVSWIPHGSQVGTVSIVLTASDPQGGVAVQSFSVDVRPANRVPAFRSNPVLSVSQGGLYQYDVLAVDPDREPLIYELLQGPPGMTIDSLGRVRWQTQLTTPLGGRDVSIRVRDGFGAIATQSFTFAVVEDTQAPRLTIVVSGEPVLFPWTVHPAIVRVIAADNVGLASVELRVDGEPVELAPDGTARVYFSAPGNGRLVATARDAAGNVGTATGRVNMRSGEEDGSGNPAPEASITSVGSGAAVRGFVDIVGTALSPDFERYKLSYRRIDQTEYKLIRESTTSVSAASLGQWDTTLLENDNYVLKLEVIDTFGSFAGVEVEVSVTGNLKLGNFRLSFEDMTIPVAGIPITIVRTYDTLRADRDGDFGYGWRLEYRDTDLRTSLPKSGLEDIGIYTPFKEGTRVFLTLPGGSRQGFTFTPEYRVLPGFGSNNNLIVAFPKFTSDRGVTSTLSAGSGALIVNEFGELFASGGVPWNPASPDFGGYTLTTADGTRYRIDGASGLMTSATGRNGNMINFGVDQISSTDSGLDVRFSRDISGRIATITDPSGNSVHYRYSVQGDLLEVVDREGKSTTFKYRSTPKHYLIDVVDALGHTGARIDYDPEGRMSLVASGQDAVTALQYDIANNLVSSRDTLGNVSLRGYDQDGNITLLIDPLGRTSRWNFDSLGQVTSITTADGANTLIERDALGREVSRRSPSGEVTRYVYGPSGNLTGYVDALGNTWRFRLDEKGNRLEESDPLGNLTLRSYDQRGRVVSLTDPEGYETTFEYGPTGLLTNTKLPDGTIQSLVYDTSGRMIGSEFRDSQGSEPVAIQFELDRNGRPIAFVDGAGNRSTVSLNATGQPQVVRDASGRSMSFEYDASGYQKAVLLDSSTAIRYEYDENGRLQSQTAPGGYRLRNMIDAAGQVTSVILPDLTMEDSDNPRSIMNFDQAGRLIKRQESNGQTSEWAYDLNGRVIHASSPQGTSTSAYDAAGRLVSSLDHAGNITSYEYDAAGRVVAISNWQGRTTFSYDRRGNLLSTEDPLGRSKTFEYDALSRRTAVIEADGDRYEFEYTIFGKVSVQRDPLGRETHYGYDASGRNTYVKTPGGAITRYEYDASGRLIKSTRPDGTFVEFGYDHQGRLSEKRHFGNDAVQIEYSPFGQAATWTSGSDRLTNTYDSLGRLIKRTQPNGDSIEYEYDSLGRILKVTTGSGFSSFEYSDLGRLHRVIDSSGVAVEYHYDDIGRLVQKKFANGTSENFDFSPTGLRIRSRLLGLSGQVLDQIDYAYDSLGRLIGQQRLDGQVQRYEYDLQDRIVLESLTTPGVGTTSIRYSYDRVGNRLTMEDEQGVTRYEYDLDDRLVKILSPTDTISFIFDSAGRRVSERSSDIQIDYVWGPEDRLLEVRRTIASEVSVIQYGYDPAGNRISRTENGRTTHFIVDEQLYGRSTILEERVNENELVRYISGLAREASVHDDTTTYFSTDIRNSPIATMNSQGEVKDRLSWSAFGIGKSALPEDTPGFTGESWDASTDLLHLRARDYQPSTGQFLSTDPFPAVKEISESLHRYAYAHQSPTLRTDPSGLSTLLELSQTMKAIGGLAVATGITGAFMQYVSGSSEKWEGLSVSIAPDKVGVSLGAGGTYLTRSEKNPSTGQTTSHKAFHFLFFETSSYKLPIPSLTENQVAWGQVLATLTTSGFGFLLSNYASKSPIDIQVSTATMFTPVGGFATLIGPFLSIGGGASGGIGATLGMTALYNTVLRKVGVDALSTAIGGQLVIQGFGYGYSLLNTGLTLKPSAGLQVMVGISLGWGWESQSGAPDLNA